ncbi:thioredoxin fold domain-containing protein [Dechloromonas sp.]|uniref:thioredoxin fold domain-containing protein n=1 Tax=Dechloromonas sp. TaxID=1917218 RepID=UPI00263F9549|nr:thioredoxin fold domain-containing protein [Dechloromonas sp.]
MLRHLAGLLGGLILACSPALALDASGILPAVDLRSEATAAARAGAPLVVIFSRDDCKFCKAIKRDYLLPMSRQPRHRDRLVVREVRQDSEQVLTGFSGEKTSHASFARSEKVKLVPVVAFYGPEGKPLAEPIVGARLPDFYQSYLDDGVEAASRKLQKR